MESLKELNVKKSQAEVKELTSSDAAPAVKEGYLKKWLAAEKAAEKPRKGVVDTLNKALLEYAPALNEDGTDDDADKVDDDAGYKPLPTTKVDKSKKAPVKRKDTWHVIATCNMVLKDLGQLRDGEVCEISDKEFQRLKKDERGPFWEE